MKKKKKIYDGTTKKNYSTDDADKLIQEFKDSAAFFDGIERDAIKGKGAINNQISAFLFNYLSNFHLPTHYLKKLNDRNTLVRQLDMIPIEILMRNIAASSLIKRFGIEEGEELSLPVREFYLKDDSRKNPTINDSHIIAFKLATADELKLIERMASKVNAILKSFFFRRQIKLVDFKLEFGRYKNKIVIGDEISVDTCRFWDVSTDSTLSKNKFWFDSNNDEQAYNEIRDRVLN